MRKWQPIGTAPKDDNEVLLYSPDGSIVIASWREDANMWDADFGWVKTGPTHWMPLPEPPDGGRQL